MLCCVDILLRALFLHEYFCKFRKVKTYIFRNWEVVKERDCAKGVSKSDSKCDATAKPKHNDAEVDELRTFFRAFTNFVCTRASQVEPLFPSLRVKSVRSTFTRSQFRKRDYSLVHVDEDDVFSQLLMFLDFLTFLKRTRRRRLLFIRGACISRFTCSTPLFGVLRSARLNPENFDRINADSKLYSFNVV